MRPHGTAKSLEKRRRQAVKLSKQELGLREIARRLRASSSSVHRWLETFRKKGEKGLASKPTPGRPNRLTSRQRARLQKILLRGAMAQGFPNELWTLKRMAAVIRREFGVAYHPCHVWRLLQRCGWSCQVPERRAVQRNEQEIAHWKRHTWPAIKKTAKAWRPSRVSG